MDIHVYGIRHHGPGCARSLRRALDELAPDIVVMEGPADAQNELSWAAHAGMKPPVALLIYPPDEPRRGVYFPLAVFSPEWQTLQWAAPGMFPFGSWILPSRTSLPSSGPRKSRRAARRTKRSQRNRNLPRRPRTQPE